MQSFKRILTWTSALCLLVLTASCEMMSPGDDVVETVAVGTNSGSGSLDKPAPVDPADDNPQDDANDNQGDDGKAPDPKVNPDLHMPDLDLAAPKLPIPPIPAYIANKPEFQNFSEPLKERIYQNLRNTPEDKKGYFLSSFGYYKPTFKPASQMDRPGNLAGAASSSFMVSGNALYSLIVAAKPQDPSAIKVGECDNTKIVSEFICIAAPVPDVGATKIFTDQGSVDMTVFINSKDLNTNAGQFPKDAIVSVTAINSDQQEPQNESLFFENDLSLVDKDGIITIKPFSMPLSGGGRTVISINAYSISGNKLVTKSIEVFRNEPVKFTFIGAWPVQEGQADVGEDPKDSLNNNDVTSADSIRIKVRLDSVYSPGTFVEYKNRDKDGALESFGVVGKFSADQAAIDPKDSKRYFTKTIRLHQDLNAIEILGGTVVDKDGHPLPSQSVNLNIYNYGKPQIKLINNVITQTKDDETVNLDFCYTLSTNVDQNAAHPHINGACLDSAGYATKDVKIVLNEVAPGKGTKVAVNEIVDGGHYRVKVKPKFGVNFVNIYHGDVLVHTDAFLFGEPVKFVEKGAIKNSGGNFTLRGLGVDLSTALLDNPNLQAPNHDVRYALQKLLSGKDIADFVKDAFVSQKVEGKLECSESGGETGGVTSINFTEGTFKLGEIEITSFKPKSGSFELGVIVHGLHGDAQLLDLGFSPKKQQENAVPLKFSVHTLKVNLTLAINKNGLIDIRPGKKVERLDDIPSPFPLPEWMDAIGDGLNGAYISVSGDSSFGDANTTYGVVVSTFNDTLETTFLCGVEKDLNEKLANATDELDHLVSDPDDDEALPAFDENMLRFGFDFEFLNKKMELTTAIDFLHSDTYFDDKGVHISNLPVRFNPGKKQLDIIEDLATISRLKPDTELNPAAIELTGDYNIGVRLGEDVINQALSALVGSLRDPDAKKNGLNIDANSYAKGESFPVAELAPLGSALAPAIDLNFDGVANDIDANTPVLLKVMPSTATPPMLTMLTQTEIDALKKSEDNAKSFFKGEGPFFALSVPNLRISAFAQNHASENPEEDFYYYCSGVADDDKLNKGLADAGFCSLQTDVYEAVRCKYSEDLYQQATGANLESNACQVSLKCENPSKVLRKNGGTLSFDKDREYSPENPESLVPIYTVKINLRVYVKYAGVNQMALSEDLIKDAKSPKKTTVHLQVASTQDIGNSPLVQSSIIVEDNHSNIGDSGVADVFNKVLKAAFAGEPCKSILSEFRIQLDDKTVLEPEKDSILEDLGLKEIGLTGTKGTDLLNVFVDKDSPWYLNAKIPLTLIYE